MVVGTGIIIIRLPENDSLKGKRKVIKSIIGKIKNTFNASAAEIGANDIHRRIEIGFALVGNDQSYINSKIDKIFNMVDDMGMGEILDTDMEIMTINFN